MQWVADQELQDIREEGDPKPEPASTPSHCINQRGTHHKAYSQYQYSSTSLHTSNFDAWLSNKLLRL